VVKSIDKYCVDQVVGYVTEAIPPYFFVTRIVSFGLLCFSFKC